MAIWNTYPSTYRAREIQAITVAVQAGECVAVIGLSGSGKSNLLGYLAHRMGRKSFPAFVLVDCNRLPAISSQALFALMCSALGETVSEPANSLNALDQAIGRQLENTAALCLLLDRFDALNSAESVSASPGMDVFAAIASNLRSLRDAHKYDLTYVVAVRRPLDPHTELAELFYAHNLWLGPLCESDARWNVERYANRASKVWQEEVIQELIKVSWGYPSFLRAVCEAYASGASLEASCLATHPAVRRRVDEFLADHPDEQALHLSGLAGHPFLSTLSPAPGFDPSTLTAKENLLWKYLCAHPHQVCEKDDLIRSVWPEDRFFERGVRDDSLAQLVRRLREKIEPTPSSPTLIHTIPGRGYRFTPPTK